MPINFGEPTTTSTYSGVPTSLRDAIAALSQMLDPSYAGTLTATPTGAKRMNAGKFEEFNGTSWVEEAMVYAKTASPTFTGTPAAPTAAAGTNTTQLATTAFVIGQAANVAPLMDGTATIGVNTRYARQDHVHPTDTSRAPLASPTFTGNPAAPTQAAGNNSTRLATTAFVMGEVAQKLDRAGGTLSGEIRSDSGLALRMTHASGYIAGYDAANTVRTGYLQFVSGSYVILNAEQTNHVRIYSEAAERLRITALLSDFKNAARTSPVSVSYAASLTVNAAAGNFFKVGNLTGNVTGLTISSAAEGQFIAIRFRQDATGGRTIALPAGAKVSGSYATGANRASYLNLTWNVTDARWEGSWLQVPA